MICNENALCKPNKWMTPLGPHILPFGLDPKMVASYPHYGDTHTSPNINAPAPKTVARIHSAWNSSATNSGGLMPRALAESGRVELRLCPEDKATLTRAASIKRLDLTGYILRAVLPQAQADISEAEWLALSERDSLRVLALLENPPPAPDRLARAARAGFTL
jgi:uncharacterized protein (DUF1778 family)